ncbi:MAG: 5-formyltetrahydrofolate cyclo-ligase [Crocinitomicaceae bacterium]
MLKSEIRSLIKEKRTGLSPFDISRISSQVLALVMDSFSFKGKYVSLFLPIEKQHELNTYGFLEEIVLKGGFPVLSKSNFSDHSLSLFLYEGTSQLALSSIGIPEPKSGREIPEEKLDFVFVPLLAINHQGHRVGYGKGFYDRLLSKCKPDCLFIGLNLFDEFVEISDLNKEDIPLHICFTPNGKYDFR